MRLSASNKNEPYQANPPSAARSIKPTAFDGTMDLASIIELQNALAQLRQLKEEKEELEQQVLIQRKELVRTNFLFREVSAELAKSEEKLRKSKLQAKRQEEVNQDLARINDRLSQTHRRLSESVKSLVHELKAPMRGVRSLADWLLKDYSDQFDAAGRKQIKMLLTRVQQMHRILQRNPEPENAPKPQTSQTAQPATSEENLPPSVS